MLIEWNLLCEADPYIRSRMQEAAVLSLAAEGVQLPCAVTVCLCDDPYIAEINKQYRHIDRPTDVLSFPSVSYPEGKTAGECETLLRQEYDDDTGACFLGDLFISVPHMKAQAKEYGHSELREAVYLTVHGLCHLMGYDHIEPQDKELMRKMEEKILNNAGIRRDESPAADDESLLALAREAMNRSYSPYSGYPVGAALHATDGRIFQGCNIENASFGATICAERTAMVKAVSEGAREFDVIAIATRDTPGWPCGICRQFMSEFAPDLRVLVTWGDGQHVEESTLEQILPHQFVLKGKKS